MFTDEAGNFYFVSFTSGRCQKLNVLDEDNVTITAYTPGTYILGDPHEFCMDSAGNVFFS